MSDHARLLRQIFTEARPLVVQALELAEKFKGFRDLASNNGLDWSQIKALLKAQVQDEIADDGNKRVDRIIHKAEFASAYADMLRLGTSNMNEDNFSASEASYADEDRGVDATLDTPLSLPPHDSDGVLIEPDVTRIEAEGARIEKAWTTEQNFDRSTGAAVVTTDDCGGTIGGTAVDVPAGTGEQSEKVANGRRLHCPSPAVRAVQYLAGQGASSPALNPEPAAAPSEAEQGRVASVVQPPVALQERPQGVASEGEAEHSLTVSPSQPDLTIPPFLKRGDPECMVRT